MLLRCITPVRSHIKTALMLGSVALGIAPALAGSGPFQVLYIFPGVTDNGGGAGAGVATAVHCFSFSPATETIQFVVRNAGGTLVANKSDSVTQFGTFTAQTHPTFIFSGLTLMTGAVEQGGLGISATSPNIVCTASIVDASATVPNGIELHGTRFNPISGSQE